MLEGQVELGEGLVDASFKLPSCFQAATFSLEQENGPNGWRKPAVKEDGSSAQITTVLVCRYFRPSASVSLFVP